MGVYGVVSKCKNFVRLFSLATSSLCGSVCVLGTPFFPSCFFQVGLVADPPSEVFARLEAANQRERVSADALAAALKGLNKAHPEAVVQVSTLLTDLFTRAACLIS